MMRRNLLAAACLASVLIVPDAPAMAGEAFTLDAVRAQVKRDYPQVPSLPTEDLAAGMVGGNDLLIIDVREPREYAVSRLPGAIRVDAGISPAVLHAQLAARMSGRRVVFYCSVGVRSARLAARVQPLLEAEGATVANLDGGIFAWHAERRALVNAQGSTNFVHPYDKKWGRLVARAEDARTAP